MKPFKNAEIDEVFADYILALKKMVQINSIEGEAEEGAPYGRGPREALAQALHIAEDWGFQTTVIADAIGYAEWVNDPGTSAYVGVLGHVDIVPAADGWTSDPFELTIRDGNAYGRGVLDNKGPILASLFAAKLLKDSGKSYQKNLRVIFGTNEETGSKDIPHYLTQEEPPLYGCTPDSQFPVVYGEKGIVGVSYRTKFFPAELNDLSFGGSFISSSVPDFMEVGLPDGEKRIFSGGRAPSNEPQLGENVITKAAEVLRKDPRLSPALQRFFHWVFETFHGKHFGEGLSHYDANNHIQITPYGIAVEDEGILRFDVSYRYGIQCEMEEILTLLGQSKLAETEMEVIRTLPPKVLDMNHPMIGVMQRVYEAVTGLDGSPIVTTGATYARFMPNIVAFGPSFPGQIGIAHNKDEYMAIDDLKRNITIYQKTLDELLM